MTLNASVDPHSPALAQSPVLWEHNFPSADLVSAAAGLFHGHRVADRELGVTLVGGDRTGASYRKGVELGHRADPSFDTNRGTRATGFDHEMVEGPRYRILVSPGTVSVRFTDPARAERGAERQERADRASADATARALLAGHDPDPAPSPRGRMVTGWSAKSRSRMVETLASLDWTAMFTTDEVPGMLTLTYPGDWLAVAPDAASARRHLKMFVRRYERAWGRRLIGVWKREFQHRGAPHLHILMVPPHGRRGGRAFHAWASKEWADVVGSESCGEQEPARGDDGRVSCCERHRHELAGVGLDFAKGVKSRDPRSIGVYFSKHGAFASKDYQNDPPAEWVENGSVGRFWGRWGLYKAVAGVEVSHAEWIAAKRTLRRLSRANAYEARVPAWRYRTVSRNVATGEHVVKWRRVTKKARVYRVKGTAGYLVVRDGPAVAAAIARHLDRLRRPERVVTRSGAGPVGFLP